MFSILLAIYFLFMFFLLATQVLYHLSHAHPFFLELVYRKCVIFLPTLAWTTISYLYLLHCWDDGYMPSHLAFSLRWGFANFLPGLTSVHDPSDLFLE
jgi:hypothetical protein